MANESDADYSTVTVRTQDGLSIDVDVSFQYLITKDQLFDVFDKFAGNEKTFFIAYARGSVRDTGSFFQSAQYVTNRTLIGATIETNLAEILANQNCTLLGLQVRNIGFPDSVIQSYENIQQASLDSQQALLENNPAIIRQNTTSQLNILLAINDQLVQQIQAQTSQLVALITANATQAARVIQANGDLNIATIEAQTLLIQAMNNASVTVIAANASAIALTLQQTAQTSMYSLQQEATIQAFNSSAAAEYSHYSIAATMLNLNASDVVNYKFLDVLKLHDTATLYVDSCSDKVRITQ